jgi:hypothetical protein
MNQKESIHEGPTTISPAHEDVHHHLREIAHIISHIPGLHPHKVTGDGREHANKWGCSSWRGQAAS